LKTNRTWILIGLTTLLAGCGAAHPCIHGKGGVCIGPREVWGVTRHRDQVKPDKNTIKDQQLARKLLREKPSKKDELPSLHPGTASGETVIQKTAETSAQGKDPVSTTDTGTASLLAPLHYPKPLISQPKVLRVWVAPYRGPEGNLHFPGMVYSIITPQTWNFGQGSAHAQVPVPVS